MDSTFIPLLLGGLLGFTAYGIPSWYYLRGLPRLDGKQLARYHADKSYVRWALPLCAVLMFVGILWPVSAGTTGGSPGISFNVAAALLASQSLIIGVFEIMAGVSVISRRRAPAEYIVGEKVSQAGRIRVVYSLMVIALSYWVRLVW